MSRTRIGAAIVLACILAATAGFAQDTKPKGHRQLDLSLLGRPTATKRAPARKINELLLVKDRLYIGHGCFAANTGPTDIMYCDLSTGKFVTEGNVDDEAITKYRLLDGRLAIPGIDATEDWSFGNCYARGAAGWRKHRSIPKGLHVFDMVAYAGRWYAVTHTLFEFPWGAGLRGKPGVAMVLSSGDHGTTWRFEYAQACDINADGLMKAIIPFKDKLYAFPYAQTFPNTKAAIGRDGKAARPIYDAYGSMDTVVYDGRTWRPVNLIREPGVKNVSPFRVKDKLALWVNFKPDPGQPRKRKLYEFDGKTVVERPFEFGGLRDKLAKPDRTFLLLKRASGSVIAETQDLKTWTYYAWPDELGDPRSLEFDGRIFYVGTADGSIYRAAPMPQGKTDPKRDAALAELRRSAKVWLAEHNTPADKRKSVATFKDGRAWAKVYRVRPSHGNCDTDFVKADLATLGITQGSRFRVGFKDKSVEPLLGQKYSDVEKGQWIALLNSLGDLRIARRDASAAEALGCKAGDLIWIAPLAPAK